MTDLAKRRSSAARQTQRQKENRYQPDSKIYSNQLCVSNIPNEGHRLNSLLETGRQTKFIGFYFCRKRQDKLRIDESVPKTQTSKDPEPWASGKLRPNRHTLFTSPNLVIPWFDINAINKVQDKKSFKVACLDFVRPQHPTFERLILHCQAQPRSQGPLSSSFEKVPWFRLVTWHPKSGC